MSRSKRRSHQKRALSPSLSTASVITQPQQPVTKNSTDLWQIAISVLFHFLLFAVPLSFTWFNEELFEFNKMILTYGVAAIIGGLWLGRMVFYRQVIFKRTLFDWAILLFLISQVLSTIFSIDFHTSLFGYYTRFHGGLLSTISYIVLFYAFMSNIPKRQIKSLLLTTFISALLVSLMAIPEHYGHSFSCLMVNTAQGVELQGWGKTLSEGLAGKYNVSCWVQDVQSRVFASFGQPNWLAAYAITLIPLGAVLTLFRNNNKTWQQWLTQALFFLSTVGLFLSLLFTQSRSGFLGYALGTVLFIGGGLLLLLKKSQQSKKTETPLTFTRLLITVIGFPLFFAGIVAIFGSPYTSSLSKLFEKAQPTPQTQTPPPDAQPTNRLEVGGTDSGEIRKIVWTGAVRVWQRYPLLGSGVETFAYSYYKDRPVEHNLVSEWDFLYNKAHNEFLNFLATTGIVGLFSYILLLTAFIGLPLLLVLSPEIFTTIRSFLKKNSSEWIHSEAHQLLALAISSGLLALTISNALGFSTVMVTILLFLLPAVFEKSISEEDQALTRPVALPDEPMALVQNIEYLVIVFIAGWCLFAVYMMWFADYSYTLGKRQLQTGSTAKGLENLQRATEISPNEPYFYDELSVTYARIATSLAKAKEAAYAEQYVKNAEEQADKMLEANPFNLNFYKSHTRSMLMLAEVKPELLYKAKETLVKARTLAPTDAKILYNLALIEISLGEKEAGIRHLEETITLKPNYEGPRLTLGEEYAKAGKKAEAAAQFEAILKMNPENEKALENLKALQNPAKKTQP